MSKSLIATLFLFAFVAIPALAERGDDAERASKNGKTEGSIEGVEIVIEYGRPQVKGRTVYGELVPYGKVWRTGANEATTITFSSDVKIEGQPLAAGTYALFTIPGEKKWTVIFNRTADQWGSFDYDAKQDALRVEVAPVKHAPTEILELAIEKGSVVLRWAEVAVPFHVTSAG